MPQPLRHEDFAPHVGKSFHFAGWHGVLRLAQIDVLPASAAPAAAHTPFSLLFHGTADDVLPEGLYRIRIENGPAVEFYILPIHTATRDRQDYQAVFN